MIASIELNECKTQCEVMAEQRYRNQIQEVQLLAAERETSLNRVMHEQKIEMDRLKQIIKTLRTRHDDLEEELDQQSYTLHKYQRTMRSSQSNPLESTSTSIQNDSYVFPSHREKMNSSVSFSEELKGSRRGPLNSSRTRPMYSLSENIHEDDTDTIGEQKSQQDHPNIIYATESQNDVSYVKKPQNGLNLSANQSAAIPSATEEATSMIIQSQLESMRQQLGRFLDLATENNAKIYDPSKTPIQVNKVDAGASSRASSQYPMSFMRASFDQSMQATPQAMRSSYEIPSSLMRPMTLDNSLRPTSSQRYSNLDTEVLDRDNTFDAEPSFEAIEDGGYHQGYWKAKYLSKR